MHNGLQGKRILVTQANEFMGPALCEVLTEHGATVIKDTRYSRTSTYSAR